MKSISAILLLMVVSACSSDDKTASETPANGANDVENTQAQATNMPTLTTATAQNSAAPEVPDNIITPVSTPAPSAPELTRYRDKYPFNDIDGVEFLNHPAVRSAIEEVVTSPDIRSWVLRAGSNPWSPIVMRGDTLVATGCQQHACDERSWAIAMDTKTHVARVCFEHNGASRWYTRNGVTPLEGDCPTSEDNFDS